MQGWYNQIHRYYADKIIIHELDKSNNNQKQYIYKIADIHNICDKKHFRCHNNVCIPEHLRCDGFYHCNDLSDELGCPKLSRKTVGLDPIRTMTTASSLNTTTVFMSQNQIWLLNRTSTVFSNLNTISTLPTTAELLQETSKVTQSSLVLSSTTMSPNNCRLNSNIYISKLSNICQFSY